MAGPRTDSLTFCACDVAMSYQGVSILWQGTPLTHVLWWALHICPSGSPFLRNLGEWKLRVAPNHLCWWHCWKQASLSCVCVSALFPFRSDGGSGGHEHRHWLNSNSYKLCTVGDLIFPLRLSVFFSEMGILRSHLCYDYSLSRHDSKPRWPPFSSKLLLIPAQINVANQELGIACLTESISWCGIGLKGVKEHVTVIHTYWAFIINQESG